MKTNDEILREQLQKGATHFQFVKKDGTIRDAYGTLNIDEIPEEDKQFASDDDKQKERKGIVTFYDLEKNAWRSCREENVISVEVDDDNEINN